LLVTAVHEAGHLIAYLSLGFQPVALHVGPLFFPRYFRGWKKAPNLLGLFGMSGSVTGIPPLEAPAAAIRRYQLVTLSAGPLAQIGLVVPLLLLQALWPQPHNPTILGELFFWLTYCGMVTLPFSLLPNLQPWSDNNATRSLEGEQAFLRAEAAVLLAEGKPDEAAVTAQRSLALLDEFTEIGNARAEEAWLAGLLRQIDGQQKRQ
jgi:hypothetical protein